MNDLNFEFRTEVRSSDIADVEAIVRSTGFFREDEILVAVDLVSERLSRGMKSGYEFIFADIQGKTVGYACYGLIPCSLISYDLYWIVIHQDYRRRGLGKLLLNETESSIVKTGGRTIYIETSSRESYKSTRDFYLSNKYTLKICFEDFYDTGDDKLIFVKSLNPP